MKSTALILVFIALCAISFLAAQDADSSDCQTMIGLLPNNPNPFKPCTTIAFNLDREAEFTITIHDHYGQLVQQYNGIGREGRNSFEWDGKDQAGRMVEPGVFLINMCCGEYNGTCKAILMK